MLTFRKENSVLRNRRELFYINILLQSIRLGNTRNNWWVGSAKYLFHKLNFLFIRNVQRFFHAICFPEYTLCYIHTFQYCFSNIFYFNKEKRIFWNIYENTLLCRRRQSVFVLENYTLIDIFLVAVSIEF